MEKKNYDILSDVISFNQGFDRSDVIRDASLAHVASAGRMEDEDPGMVPETKRGKSWADCDNKTEHEGISSNINWKGLSLAELSEASVKPVTQSEWGPEVLGSNSS